MDIKPSEFYLWNSRYSIFQWQQFEFPSDGRWMASLERYAAPFLVLLVF
jgi:hypothetical protein